MVSRVYPPPVSPRNAGSGGKDSGKQPTGPSGDETRHLSEANPAQATTNISPLARITGQHPKVPSVDQDDDRNMNWPTVNSTEAAWTTQDVWPTAPETISAPTIAPRAPLDRAPRDLDLAPTRRPSPDTGIRTADRPPSTFENDLSALDGFAPEDVTGLFETSSFDIDNQVEGQTSQTMTLERPRIAPDRHGLSPRFEFSTEMETPERQTRSRRMVQGTVLLAVMAAVASFIVLLPEDESTSIESADASTQIRTVDTPTASAELLASGNQPQVEGALGDTGDLGRPTAFAAGGIGTPADSGEGFASAVATELEENAPEQATTSTTAWVEPTLPPESAWVDAGNGVMVPDLLLRIRFCESTNNYNAANSRSTARGAYQFLNKSWDWYGHAARTGVAEAHLATRAQQDESALLTLQSQGTSPWLASRSCWAADDIDPTYATATPAPAPTTTTTDGSSSTTIEDGSSTSSSTATSVPQTTVPASSSTTETTEASTTTSTTENSTTSSTEASTTTTTTTTTTTP